MTVALANPSHPPSGSTMTDARTNPIIDARNIAVDFKVEHGVVEAVKDISFQLYRGETIAIVGESGSGKSVTARTVMGLLSKRATVSPKSSVDYRRARHPEIPRACPAQTARQPHLDDLPGADEFAQSDLHGRQPDRRGDQGAPQDEPQAGLGTGARTAASRCRFPTRSRGSGNIRTSSPAGSASA